MPESPEVRYAEREQRSARLRDQQRRKSAVLARLRLATFLPAVATLVWWLGFDGGIPAFVLSVVLLLAFGALVVCTHGSKNARSVSKRSARSTCGAPPA